MYFSEMKRLIISNLWEPHQFKAVGAIFLGTVVMDDLYEYVYYACAGGEGLLLELLEFVDICVSQPKIKPNGKAN